jgi:multicomponent K+:H+ antiporter subunit E
MWHTLVPHPYLTLALTIVWVLLVDSFSPGAIIFGLLLGVIVPILTSPFWPDRPRLRNAPVIIKYILVVLRDIVVANFEVAYLVLFKRNQDLRPAFMTVPLELRTPEAITMLAGTITMTPGTLSVDLSADGRALLVHGLNVTDPDAVVAEIKQRYEARLKEIFE